MISFLVYPLNWPFMLEYLNAIYILISVTNLQFNTSLDVKVHQLFVAISVLFSFRDKRFLMEGQTISKRNCFYSDRF